MQEREEQVDLGVIINDGSLRITDYIEKPKSIYHVSMGIYVFEPRILTYIPHNQYMDFPDLVLKLIANDELVFGYPFSGYWQDLGRKEDYEKAVNDFDKMRSEILGETNENLV